jgi:hypothetical protein
MHESIYLFVKEISYKHWKKETNLVFCGVPTFLFGEFQRLKPLLKIDIQDGGEKLNGFF